MCWTSCSRKPIPSSGSLNWPRMLLSERALLMSESRASRASSNALKTGSARYAWMSLSSILTRCSSREVSLQSSASSLIFFSMSAIIPSTAESTSSFNSRAASRCGTPRGNSLAILNSNTLNECSLW